MASRISRRAAKSGCAWEWGAWGQISEDGPGQHNPDRSEDPWGRAAEAARTEVVVAKKLNRPQRADYSCERRKTERPAEWTPAPHLMGSRVWDTPHFLPVQSPR